MAIEITPDEIRKYGITADDEQIEQIISDAIDQAELFAPGVGLVDDATSRAVAAVIRGAVVRYIETGQNAEAREGKTSVSNSAGPWSEQSSYRERTAIFLPSEERKIAEAVKRGKRRAFAVDLTPPIEHRPCGLCAPGTCLGWC
ncbi:Gp19/Gp15/Gp42 family protein [Corynebacterium glyciniphilum]|uniref:Gp19/Gp15/Gp42 family protein n=1 Tax=Corynebacterium glyciniphilum TaxID=1404244 RepID=UPI002653A76F|nr:Gp19/Gp15/Gp42 family protein [Corynebacterium glyciniphilum]MDN6706381.1 Gp19/Gp15/Gp42 family protein [Corynebacterium glyciniphilum]